MSFDYAPTTRTPMPLTEQLFEPNFRGPMRDFPEVKNIAMRLDQAKQRGSGLGLEAELGRLQQLGSSDPVLARQLFQLRHFLQRLIGERAATVLRDLADAGHYSNYLRLMNVFHEYQRVSGEAIALVTFNYDVMLDDACREQALGWPLKKIDDYVSRDDFRLYKLHGSTDWSRRLPRPTSRRPRKLWLIELSCSISASKISCSNDRDWAPRRAWFRCRQSLSPVNTKFGFECPESHLTRLEADLGLTDSLLVVGSHAGGAHHAQHDHADPPGPAREGGHHRWRRSRCR